MFSKVLLTKNRKGQNMLSTISFTRCTEDCNDLPFALTLHLSFICFLIRNFKLKLIRLLPTRIKKNTKTLNVTEEHIFIPRVFGEATEIQETLNTPVLDTNKRTRRQGGERGMIHYQETAVCVKASL